MRQTGREGILLILADGRAELGAEAVDKRGLEGFEMDIDARGVFQEEDYRCRKDYGHMALEIKDSVDAVKGNGVEGRLGAYSTDGDVFTIDGDIMTIHLGREEQADVEIVGRSGALVILLVDCLDNFLGNHGYYLGGRKGVRLTDVR